MVARPEKTTFMTMLIADSSSAISRELCLKEMLNEALDKWESGTDLQIVIREPTDREKLLMHAHTDDPQG